VNFQPATEAAPAGYLKDAGSVYSVRSNGKSYGWNNGISLDSRIRRGAVPIPELDTLIHMQKGGPTKIWEYALPNGSYPVIVVAGDPSHRDQTNNLSIEGIQVIDPDPSAPQGYEKGDFDGYAVQVTITDGRLTIQPGSGAVNAKICYVEIGAQGTTIDQATKDRLAALIEQATTRTAATVQSTTAKRQYVFGSYVDELLSYTNNGTRYFTHSNHLYSPSAVTNAAGQVQERYRYDAYGKQTITNATGTVRNQSTVGFSRGFTGYILDEETGLYYARTRMYEVRLGRFIARDPGSINGPSAPDFYHGMTPKYRRVARVRSGSGLRDGMSFYSAYFAPNKLDPNGLTAITGEVRIMERDIFWDDVEVKFTFKTEVRCTSTGVPVHDGLDHAIPNDSGDDSNSDAQVISNAACSYSTPPGIFIEWTGQSVEGDVPFWNYVGVGIGGGAVLGGGVGIPGGPAGIGLGTGVGTFLGGAGAGIVGGIGEAFDDEWQLDFLMRWKVCCKCVDKKNNIWVPNVTFEKYDLRRWSANSFNATFEIEKEHSP